MFQNLDTAVLVLDTLVVIILALQLLPTLEAPADYEATTVREVLYQFSSPLSKIYLIQENAPIHRPVLGGEGTASSSHNPVEPTTIINNDQQPPPASSAQV